MSPGAPHEQHRGHAPRRLRFAVVTISDSRRGKDDTGGALCADLVASAGHEVSRRAEVPDDVSAIRGAVEAALAAGVDVVLTTGGTGVSPRDVTPEALRPLLDKELPGFGEAFRAQSWQEVGSAAIASRALAGTRGASLVVALPGSPAACRLALERVLLPEVGHLVGQLRR